MKIINIGLPRTGTYSLSIALKKLGLSCVHYPEKIDDIDEFDSACEVVFSYEEIEKRFPNSLYIYTKRDFKSWHISCKKHKLNYKEDWNSFWTKDWKKEYFAKENSLDFFSDKRERILMHNVFEGDGWKNICDFLNKKVPSIPYPHLNASRSYRKSISLI